MDIAIGGKRKRSPEIPLSMQRATGEQLTGGNQSITPINYLVKARNEKLRLLEADYETFGDVLGLLEDYEGVLQRRESLAANLGAKLVGPLLLKSIEKLFDGPIKIFQPGDPDANTSNVTWLDMVSLARSDPSSFILSTTPQGTKACRFFLKGQGVEITEDDYRLLMSGAPERMLPSNPIPEDESAELGTLSILEARLVVLIKQADSVASKARQLNYHLKQRKTAVHARKGASASETDTPAYSPQPFSPINTIRSTLPQNGEAARLQQELLLQFSSAAAAPFAMDSATPQRRPAGTPSSRLSKAKALHHGVPAASGETEHDVRRGPSTIYDDAIDGRYRVEMAARIEKLQRGDVIYPPCDRCRRLKFDCAKHLTACTACTRKHAKCSWKDARKNELVEGAQAESQTAGDVSGAPMGIGFSGQRRGSDGSVSNGSGKLSPGGPGGGMTMEGVEVQQQGTALGALPEGFAGPEGGLKESFMAKEKVGASEGELGKQGVNGLSSGEKGLEVLGAITGVGGRSGDEQKEHVEHAMLAQMAEAAVMAGGE